MKPEQLHILQTAVRKARTYLQAASLQPPSVEILKEMDDQFRAFMQTVAMVVNMPATAPSYNDAPEVLPGTRHAPRIPPEYPAPSQAIGLMRSYLELPGSEVLTPDRWAKRAAGYLFENLGSLP